MKGKHETISGYFYPLVRKKCDSSSDEEEEEVEDFIDATDIKDVAEGGSFITALTLRLSTGYHPLPF